jgi:hypothetical protein
MASPVYALSNARSCAPRPCPGRGCGLAQLSIIERQAVQRGTFGNFRRLRRQLLLLCCFEDAVDSGAADTGQCVNAVDGEAGLVSLSDQGVASFTHAAPLGQGALGLLGARRHASNNTLRLLLQHDDHAHWLRCQHSNWAVSFDTCSGRYISMQTQPTPCWTPWNPPSTTTTAKHRRGHSSSRVVAARSRGPRLTTKHTRHAP